MVRFADAGDTEQPLDVGVRHQVRVKGFLQLLDLGLQQLGLVEVASRLELHELR
jgi:hypothetical protein